MVGEVPLTTDAPFLPVLMGTFWGALETVAVLELEKLCCIEVNLHGVPIVKLQDIDVQKVAFSWMRSQQSALQQVIPFINGFIPDPVSFIFSAYGLRASIRFKATEILLTYYNMKYEI